jgi:hypothetical protein
MDSCGSGQGQVASSYKYSTRTYRFHKMQRNVCLCKEISRFSRTTFSMQLVISFVIFVAGQIVLLPP